MAIVRVVLADDHPIYRKGLKTALATFPDIKVIGEVNSFTEAITFVEREKPEILILDVWLQKENSLSNINRIKEISSKTKVIALTADGNQQNVLTAIRFGVNGFLLKDRGIKELVECIRAVSEGKYFLDINVTEIVFLSLRKYLERDRLTTSNVDEEILSPRELEIFILVRSGLSNKKIAEHLYISTNTVHNHLVNIYRKLGVTKRRQVIEMPQE